MAEPLIDLTQPEAAKARRPSTPKAPPKARVTKSRAVSAAVTKTKEQRADEYEAWLNEHVDAYYVRGAAFLLGADPRQVNLPQPDGTVKTVAQMISWQGSPKPYMAAHAAAELQELPQVQRVISWFGPIAPWLMLGGLGIAIGMDAVAMMRLRPILKAQQAQPAQTEQVPNRTEAPEPTAEAMAA